MQLYQRYNTAVQCILVVVVCEVNTASVKSNRIDILLLLLLFLLHCLVDTASQQTGADDVEETEGEGDVEEGHVDDGADLVGAAPVVAAPLRAAQVSATHVVAE